MQERLSNILGGRTVELTLLAHSGAPIGAHESIDTNDPIRSLHGEVPLSTADHKRTSEYVYWLLSS